MEQQLKRKLINRANYIKRKFGRHDQDDAREIREDQIETSSVISGSNDCAGGLEWDISSVSDYNSDVHIEISDDDNLEADTGDSSSDHEFHHVARIHTQCPISLKESLKLVSSFQSKNNLSDQVTSGIMKLIKLHLPENNIYPSSSSQLHKALGQSDFVKKIYFCHSCNCLLRGSFTCASCDKSFDQKQLDLVHDFFVILDIRQQMELILSNVKVKSVLSAKLVRGIQSEQSQGGQRLAKLRDDAFDLTATFNSDGVQLFESSNSSIWPFLISINELPYRLRKRFMMLGGLWFCGRKINMKLFLTPIVEMLNDLYTTPITWKAEDGVAITSRLICAVCAVDSPARCKMQGLTQFNGLHGCCWCDHPGKRIPKGQGFARVYPEQGFNPKMRENLKFKHDLLQKNFSVGIKFVSPLNYLRNFDIIFGFSVDIMHAVMLGVVRSFTFLWLEDYGANYHILVKDFEAVYDKIRVPISVSRTVRSLQYRKQWKASEWQTWLYICPLLLRGMLPRKFLNHFKILVEAIHALCSSGLCQDEIDNVEEKLTNFVKKVKTLYGEEYCTYNVHILLHLARCYKLWGPLIGFSAFSFESFNGELLSKVTSSKGVIKQITRRYMSSLFSKVDNVEQIHFSDMLGFKYTPRYSVESKKLIKFVPEDVRYELNKFCNAKTIYVGKSAFINYIYFNTSSCKSVKRIDNILQLSDTTFGLIDKFYEVQCNCRGSCDCEKWFALSQTTKVEMSKRLSFCKYRQLNTVSDTFQITPFSKINPVKFYRYSCDDFEYFVRLPNSEESE